MSASDEQTSRLSEALDSLATGGGDPPPNPSASDEPFEMPDIVPATIELTRDVAAPTAPTLPPSTAAPPTPTIRPVAPQASIQRSATPAPTVAAAPAPARAPATGWSDHMSTIGAPAAAGPGLRSAHGRPRVRKVTRVVRHIDPWSTFKVALVFSAVTYLVVLTSGVLLWRVADSTGTLDNVERWFTQFGWETFELKGGEIFHNAWIIGLFGAVALTGVAVLMATLFNLVSDIVGGVRVTVLEEEVVERTITSTRRYVVRRPPLADETAGVAAPAWSLDDDDDPADEPTPSAAAADHSGVDTAVVPVVDHGDWSVDDDDAPIGPG